MAHSGLLEIHAGVAIGPTQKKGRTQWKKDLLIVNVRFNGYALGGRR